MFSEAEPAILQALLNELREALSDKKASHSVRKVQNAYMKAAREVCILERERQRHAKIIGSHALVAMNQEGGV